MPRGTYIGRLDNISVSTARTLGQLNVASTVAAQVTEIYIDFNSTTSISIRTRVSKRTTAGTGTTFTPVKLSGAASASSTFTNNHTAEGTVGDVLFDRFVNYVPGMNYLPIPENMIELAPSERLAVDFPTAPGAAVIVSAGIVWKEIG